MGNEEFVTMDLCPIDAVERQGCFSPFVLLTECKLPGDCRVSYNHFSSIRVTWGISQRAEVEGVPALIMASGLSRKG